MDTNRLIVEIFHHIHNIIIAIMATTFYLKVLTPKHSLKHPKLACYMTAFLFTFISNFCVTQYSVAASFQFLIALGIPTIFFFEEKLFSRMSIYLFICIIEFFTEAFASSIFTSVNIFIPEKNFSPRTLALNGEVIPTLICHLFLAGSFLAFTQIIGHMIDKYFQYIHLNTLASLSIPFLFIFIHHNLLILVPSEYILISSILLWITFAVMLYFLLRGINSFEYQELEHLEKENQKKQLLEQSKHYEKLYRETLKQRRWAHDLSNHLSMINYMIEHQQFDESKAYINNVIDFTTETFMEDQVNEA